MNSSLSKWKHVILVIFSIHTENCQLCPVAELISSRPPGMSFGVLLTPENQLVVPKHYLIFAVCQLVLGNLIYYTLSHYLYDHNND